MNQQFAALSEWVKAHPKESLVLCVGAGLLGYYGSKKLGAGQPQMKSVPSELLEDPSGLGLGEPPTEPTPLYFDDIIPSGILPSYPTPRPSDDGASGYVAPISVPTVRELSVNPLAPSRIYELFPEINKLPVVGPTVNPLAPSRIKRDYPAIGATSSTPTTTSKPAPTSTPSPAKKIKYLMA